MKQHRKASHVWSFGALILFLASQVGCGCGRWSKDKDTHGDTGETQCEFTKGRLVCSPTSNPPNSNGNTPGSTPSTDKNKVFCTDLCADHPDKDTCETKCLAGATGTGTGSTGTGTGTGSTSTGTGTGSTGSGSTGNTGGTGSTGSGSTGTGTTGGTSGTGSTRPPIDTDHYDTCKATCKAEGESECVCNSRCLSSARGAWVAKCWETCINGNATDSHAAAICRQKCSP